MAVQQPKPIDHDKVKALLAEKATAAKETEAKRIDAALESLRTQAAIEPDNWAKLSTALRSFLAGEAAAPKAIILTGPPGTGKTTIAKAIGKACGCRFFGRTIADIKMGHVGASAQAAKKLWEEAGATGRSVLFVDECESVLSSRTGSDADPMTKEITGVFLPYLEGVQRAGKVLFIGATNIVDSIDPAILSRFDLNLRIGLPGPDSRRQILATSAKAYALDGALVDRLVAPTEGLPGRDIDAIVRKIAQEVGSGSAFETVVDRTVAARRSQGNVATAKLTWDDVAVADDVRRSLQQYGKMLLNRERLKAAGLDAMPKGVLLHGPPGTGKTQLARVMASTCGCAFLSATSSDLKAGFVGQSGGKVRELFGRARSSSPCILFVDELDIVAAARGSSGADQFTTEIVGQMLQEIDGIRAQDGAVFLLGATNLPDSIDSAILSRFSEQIEIPLPDLDMRRRIILAVTRSRPVEGDREAFAAAIAERTDGVSGRGLSNLITRGIQRVAMRALDEPEGTVVGLRLDDLRFGDAT